MNDGDKGRLKAAALKYDREERDAPHLVASGSGRIADRIVEVAREAEVPIVEDAALVSALLALDIGEEIPLDLYEAVARVLAFIYKVDVGSR
ncbi:MULTISPECIES: EscU/YscU/HrcU family type III secretion system export apparatus switch protein [Dethiosulfovibrio]|uniref:EscU/YscU/HrcU family type III secretion system export apparatus switch protein n=2 Tax=Dethiosulfovibrio TaxID=47054 RepID=A0ABS9EK88_9BACT|nr:MULTISPECIES: EscU/YscU/HrcU family type III secretion system export apparatus switch protein [Dethiosulfovibrio]MCF4114017.1 EscU/YscU/HrcU family type III secretion system export apparatus switch protein [Dethiosulfovibrio russensis]MCF4141570.1 EscU/YscU/HrcU family type III secretion system export apparatus switch protein [Dethiosulfovibrio marinus]MCF4144013.1 EscU/YscU/HrcU family type III secretion system export apparatus switch protein [Dethiosulfovibrio acidaminovorans]